MSPDPPSSSLRVIIKYGLEIIDKGRPTSTINTALIKFNAV